MFSRSINIWRLMAESLCFARTGAGEADKRSRGRAATWADRVVATIRRSGADLADGRKQESGSPTANGASRGDVDPLAGLEIIFDAAIARDEEAAADDLAVSLDQDRTLVEVLTRTPAEVVTTQGSIHSRARMIGDDYVRIPTPSKDYLVPLYQGIYRLTAGGCAPAREDASLLETLRRMARGRASIGVDTQDASFEGTISRARRDHLELETPRGILLIPYGAVVRLSLRRGG